MIKSQIPLNSRVLFAFINGILWATIFNQFFNITLFQFTVIFALFLFINFILNNLLLVLIALITSASITSQIATNGFFEDLFQNQSVDNLMVAYLISLFIAAMGIYQLKMNGLFKNSFNKSTELGRVALLSSLLLASVTWGDWDRAKSLNFLIASGEDNGAWLQAIGESISPTGERIYSQTMAFGSGDALSSVLGTFAFLFDMNHEINYISNSIILTNLYGFVLGIFSLISGAIIFNYGLMKNYGLPSILALSFVQSWISYISLAAFFASGHLSSALSSLFFISTVPFLFFYSKTSKIKLNFFILIFFVSSLLSTAGNLWNPINLLSKILIYTYMAFLFYQLLRSTFLKFAAKKKLKLAVFLFMLSLLGSLIPLFPKFKLLISGVWSSGLAQLNLGGGTYNVSTTLLLITFLGLVGFVIGDKSGNGLLLSYFIIFISLYFMSTALISILTTSEFMLKYGALKLSIFFLCTTFIFTLMAVIDTLKPSFKSTLIFCIGVISIFSFDQSIGQFASFPNKYLQASSFAWSEKLIELASTTETKPTVCLNSDVPDRSYEAYLCTRIAMGIFGNYGDFNYAHSTWSGALLNSGEKEIFKDIPTKFYEDLTIISFDPIKRDNGTDEQKYWLQYVPWEKVTIVGVD